MVILTSIIKNMQSSLKVNGFPNEQEYCNRKLPHDFEIKQIAFGA